MPACTRTSDPSTLHQIDEEVESSGRAASQRHLCLLEVWKTPGRTAAEIAQAAGLKRHVPSRRLPKLRQTGQVKNGPERICAITGNSSLTWFPNMENTR